MPKDGTGSDESAITISDNVKNVVFGHYPAKDDTVCLRGKNDAYCREDQKTAGRLYLPKMH